MTTRKAPRRFHHCPISGCKRRVAAHLLMCPGHWGRVPEDLQKRVYGAWAAYNRACRDDVDDAVSRLDELRNVQAEAIHAVSPVR